MILVDEQKLRNLLEDLWELAYDQRDCDPDKTWKDNDIEYVIGECKKSEYSEKSS